ncbi:ABC transporter permease [Rhodococcus opacus PD630]|uniref:carbohydrate ABC transporter permease n=1 Tax=Rhodococcus TaxID=1827 RepID=UPI00029CB5F0|nr:MULTISPECIES: carbohydrate ABC transporter permease [Rhodococcus]AHK31968.1 L-arabinose transport system permease protein AraQ [Rhodococcus opacus PD630]EHI45247.1 ABC transporter permease [Rhodococcus opacus PD630]KXX56311.1 sugar ABC transporter permease [Rhodococcus sp. LB1]PBC53457.1 carbohydrate ABC transporter permease [Rhodococcus sp. ACPA1]UDG94413.1 carbohydrate ABC transporter permease [Rhodococcus opacus PD630]
MTTSESAVPEPLWRRARGHVVLVAIALVCAFPIYWLLATSLRRPDDVGSLSPVPWPLSLGNYVDATEKVDVIRLLANTFAVSGVSAAGQLLVALLASYAFAMYSFRFQRLLYLAFVGTWLVPFQVTMLPNYVLLYQMGLINNLVGVIVPTLCSALGVLMLRQHMAGFPKELVAAAKLDGRSSWSILWTVVVPNLRPALAALSILLFINAWNEYFWPAVVLQRSNAVVQLGLRSFMGTEGNDWGPMMAVAGLACLPVFVLYVVLQRHIVNAFVRSGLK